jgi:hypothetical protein
MLSVHQIDFLLSRLGNFPANFLTCGGKDLESLSTRHCAEKHSQKETASSTKTSCTLHESN